jgi:hypothetical protein
VLEDGNLLWEICFCERPTWPEPERWHGTVWCVAAPQLTRHRCPPLMTIALCACTLMTVAICVGGGSNFVHMMAFEKLEGATELFPSARLQIVRDLFLVRCLAHAHAIAHAAAARGDTRISCPALAHAARTTALIAACTTSAATLTAAALTAAALTAAALTTAALAAAARIATALFAQSLVCRALWRGCVRRASGKIVRHVSASSSHPCTPPPPPRPTLPPSPTQTS